MFLHLHLFLVYVIWVVLLSCVGVCVLCVLVFFGVVCDVCVVVSVICFSFICGCMYV